MSKTKRSLSNQAALCRRFKESLDFLGLSPSCAYEKLGYSTPSTLYSIIGGRCLPDMTRLIALSKLSSSKGYRVNIDWLVTGDGPKGYYLGDEGEEKHTAEKLLAAITKEKLDAIAILMS